MDRHIESKNKGNKKRLHTFCVCAYKESVYLEECILSLINQSVKSNIVIATSTPNNYISAIADKYKLSVFVNGDGAKGIGYDFDFALLTGDTKYVTIAHQDDMYEPNYVKKVVHAMEKAKDGIIAFTDYHEIHHGKIMRYNRNLKIKRIMLSPLQIRLLQKSKFIRRRILSLGDPICCPSVTFSRKMIDFPLFANDFKSDVDWFAWERLSRRKGSFIYIKEDLMMHRVHEASTTTQIINENQRTKEDYDMFCLFWPKWIAKIINKLYSHAEKSND